MRKYQVLDVLEQMLDEKIDYLTGHVADGAASDWANYKQICGERKGLLTAKDYISDLNKTMGNS